MLEKAVFLQTDHLPAATLVYLRQLRATRHHERGLGLDLEERQTVVSLAHLS